MLEIIVVTVILSLALAIGVAGFRNTRMSASKVASGFTLNMKLRQASDKLVDKLLDGTEVVQPVEGMTLPYFVMKDLANNLTIVYLEAAKDKSQGPYALALYTDTLTGSYIPQNRQVLFDNVNDVKFTTLSPGLVVMFLSLVDQNNKELTGMVEIPMKNIGATDR